jgi:hypothetical protein
MLLKAVELVEELLMSFNNNMARKIDGSNTLGGEMGETMVQLKWIYYD